MSQHQPPECLIHFFFVVVNLFQEKIFLVLDLIASVALIHIIEGLMCFM